MHTLSFLGVVRTRLEVLWGSGKNQRHLSSLSQMISFHPPWVGGFRWAVARTHDTYLGHRIKLKFGILIWYFKIQILTSEFSWRILLEQIWEICWQIWSLMFTIVFSFRVWTLDRYSLSAENLALKFFI